ncbi:MAG: Ig-like domain-containing protein [Gemmatimonadota bacterium]
MQSPPFSGFRRAIRFAPLFLGSLWACDGSGPTVTEVRVSPGNFTLQSLGEGIQYTAQILDAEGTALTGVQVTWSSSNPDVVTISATGQATAQGTGSSQIQASAEGVTGSAGVVVSQVPAEVRKLSGDVQTQTVNRPLETDPEVEVRDARGNPIPNATVDFSVLSGGGSVDPSIRTTDAQGRATTRWTLGPSAGEEHRLRGTASQVSTVFSAQPQADEASMLGLASGDGQQGPPGSTLPEPLTVRVMDAFENGVAGVEVTFETTGGSLAPSSGTSGADGTISTLLTLPAEEGPVLVTASSPGLGSVQFTLTSLDQPLEVVTSSVPQGRATLEYSSDGELEAVGGAAGNYTWSLTSGALPPGMEFTLEGRLLGTPSVAGEFPFRAQVRDALGNTAHKDLILEVCAAPIALQRGEQWVGTPAAPGQCGLFIPSGGNHRYRVALIRPAESMNKADVPTARLQVTGVGGVNASPVAPAMSFQDYAGYGELGGDARAGVASRMDPRALAVHEATAREHTRLRESERVMFQELFARYGRDLQVLPDLGNQTKGGQSGQSGTATGFSTGPQLSSHAPARRVFDVSLRCDTPGPERVGLLVNQNPHLAVYQDSIQRETTPVSQSAVQQMLDFYTDHGKEIIDGYFGGVSDIDGNGQVVVFVTPSMPPNVAGLVWSGDFVSKARCSASNEMEITYFSVSTINGIVDPERPNFQALTTLVHELKHVSSLHKRVRRFFNQGESNPFHPIWVEEGTAEIAAEMASRLAWSRNGGPAVTQPVQLASFQGGFTPNNFGVALRLATTVNYLSSQPNMVTENPTGAASSHTFYGSSWHFHRFIADAYLGANGAALPDAAFFQIYNDSLARPGVAGLRDVLLSQSGASRTFEELITEYTVGIMLDGTPAPAPERRFRTYIFPSVTEVFRSPDPPGMYPWPVTITGVDTGEGQTRQPAPSHVGFQTAEYAGPIAPTGIRIHEFLSNGSGLGMELHVPLIPSTALRLVVVRIF